MAFKPHLVCISHMYSRPKECPNNAKVYRVLTLNKISQNVSNIYIGNIESISDCVNREMGRLSFIRVISHNTNITHLEL